MKTSELIESIANDLGPVRRFSSPLRSALVWSVSSMVLVSCFLFMGELRRDWMIKVGEADFILEMGLFSGLSLLSMVLAVRIAIPGLAGNRWLWGSFALFLAAVTLVSGLGISESRFEFNLSDVDCTIGVAGAAILASFAAWIWLRKGASLRPGLTGVLVAISGASLGAIAIAFLCPIDGRSHISFWHFLAPFFILVLLGSFIGRRVFRW